MRNLISLWILGAMLLLISSNSSCASLPSPSLPQLENRTLRISLETPTLEYQYEDCVRKFVGICTKREMKKLVLDLTKREVRKELIDKGFVVKVREKF